LDYSAVSPQREPILDRAAVCPSGHCVGVFGTLLGASAGLGVGVSGVAVIKTVDPALPKPLTAFELALKVIPAINGLKS